MKKYPKILLMWGFLAMNTIACTNDGDEQVSQVEITLTTPVFSIEGVQATVSRADDIFLASNDGMTLDIQLLNKQGAPIQNRIATYSYNSNTWSTASPLVVTAGAGDYYARAIANNVNVNTIEGGFYVNQGSNTIGTMSVNSNGTFTFSSPFQPLTAAIDVNLIDANNQPITTGATIGLNLGRVTSVTWGENIAYTYNRSETTTLSDITKVFGDYFPTTFDENSTIMTIDYGGITYNVSTSSILTIGAGNLYTFNVQLNGNAEIKITGDIGVSSLGNGGTINVVQ